MSKEIIYEEQHRNVLEENKQLRVENKRLREDNRSMYDDIERVHDELDKLKSIRKHDSSLSDKHLKEILKLWAIIRLEVLEGKWKD